MKMILSDILLAVLIGGYLFAIGAAAGVWVWRKATGTWQSRPDNPIDFWAEVQYSTVAHASYAQLFLIALTVGVLTQNPDTIAEVIINILSWSMGVFTGTMAFAHLSYMVVCFSLMGERRQGLGFLACKYWFLIAGMMAVLMLLAHANLDQSIQKDLKKIFPMMAEGLVVSSTLIIGSVVVLSYREGKALCDEG